MKVLSGSLFALDQPIQSAPGKKERMKHFRVLWFLAVLALTAGIGLLLMRGLSNTALIAWLLFTAGAVAIIWQPRYGVYLIVFLALIGDRELIPWYPFVTNFSSMESIMYLSGSVIFSPFELYLVLTYFSWLIRVIALRKLQFFRSDLFVPAMMFLAFILFGFGYGIARGGNTNVALWEIRPIVYMPAMLVLTSNLIEKRHQVNLLMWLVMIALFLKGVIGTSLVAFVLRWNIAQVQDVFTEHSGAIQFNSFLLYTMAAWIFKESLAKRVLLPLMALPVLISLIASQRRAAYLVLFIAVILVAFILFREKKILFWTIVPAACIIFVVYAAVFWNRYGALGMPIQALKSQLLPGQAAASDSSSDLYRQMENFNIMSTIHRTPITGTGFGHVFDMVIPLPDISFFVWWRYITHNSILWIWMNTGILGFLSLLVMIGSSLMVGIRVLFRMPDGYLKTAAFSGILYIFMHFLFAYVDMSWDNLSMIYIGTMMGLIGCLEHIVSQPEELPTKRWPWQPDPLPAPTLLPFPGKDFSQQEKEAI